MQDPDEALYPFMPRSALKAMQVRHDLPLAGIAKKLLEVVPPQQKAGEEATTPRTPPRLLIVQDERLVAMNLQSRLEELGYQIVGSVGSGRQRLDFRRSWRLTWC